MSYNEIIALSNNYINDYYYRVLVVVVMLVLGGGDPIFGIFQILGLKQCCILKTRLLGAPEVS